MANQLTMDKSLAINNLSLAGYSERRIAETLGVSRGAVRRHLATVCDSLGHCGDHRMCKNFGTPTTLATHSMHPPKPMTLRNWPMSTSTPSWRASNYPCYGSARGTCAQVVSSTPILPAATCRMASSSPPVGSPPPETPWGLEF